MTKSILYHFEAGVIGFGTKEKVVGQSTGGMTAIGNHAWEYWEHWEHWGQ
jgi:hypothetical protein